MKTLENLEKTADDLVNRKGLPKLPQNARDGLAKSLWWLALVFGILELLLAWMLWRAGMWWNGTFGNAADFVNNYYGYTVVHDPLNFFFYIAILLAVLEGALLLLAVSPLKNRKKMGWNLLFYMLIINVLYAVIRLFSNVGGGVMSLFWALVATAVGAYFIFQVRDYFVTPGRKTSK